MVFSFDLFQGQVHHRVFMRARNHHDAIHVSENQIARVDADTATFNTDIAVDHTRTPLGVQGTNAAMKHGEVHLADLPYIAHEAIGDTASSATYLGGGRQQFAPWGNPLSRAIAGQHHHILDLQIVHQGNFHLVRVFPLSERIGGHVQPGPRTPDHDMTLIKRPHKRLHRTPDQTETVHDVGQDGRAQGFELGGIYRSHQGNSLIMKRVHHALCQST